MSSNARALHYVFRVGSRKASYDFFVNTLGMKVLRHEEFDEGCKATCNGPYGNKWSKTMIGYGDEDNHFVLELTYNYGVTSYELGNDFRGIHIQNDDILKAVTKKGKKNDNDELVLNDPDGHPFLVSVKKGNNQQGNDPITKVSLNVKDVHESRDFWSNLCGMKVENEDAGKQCLLSYGAGQCKLELHSLNGEKLNRGKAFGRIAFSIPTQELKGVEDKLKKANPHYIQNPLMSLDTPGKATVQVVILRDPNEHEICFVGEKEYRELSKTDLKADELLRKSIKDDESYSCSS